jgi:hypothetical protein
LLAKVLKTATLYFGLDAIYNAYKFSKESLALLEPAECSRLVLSAFAFSLFEMKKDEFKPFYRMFSQYLLNNTPIEKRADPMDLFHKCLDQQKTIIFTGSTFDDTFGKIFKLRNKKQAALLLGILIQEGHEPKYEKVYKYLTEDIIPRLLPSIIPAKWASHTFKSPNISNLVTFFSKHHRKIKDQTSSIFSTFLLATESLEFLREIPFEKKIETLEKICSQTELNDIDESLKLITYFAIKKDVDLIKELPFERPFIELTQAFQDMLYETLPVSSSSSFDPIKRYLETFGLMRISYALEIYQGTLRNEEPVVQETLHRFIQSVLANTFFEERHRTDNNPHLHAIQEFAPVVLEKWKHLSLIHETSEETVMLTQYWQDLFLSGTEITGSCQRIDASAYESKCLLAYCLDGKNSMIAVKDPSGKILARSMLRLLWNPMNERPALFLDTLYPSNCSLERKNAILSAAQECARQLGCQLFEYTSKKGEILESLGSSCPYEYADNAGGVTEGKFSISAKPITLML